MQGFYGMQHLIRQIKKKFYFVSVLFYDHCVVWHIIVVGCVIVFFKLFCAAVFLVFCNAFVPVRRGHFHVFEFQDMSGLAVFLAIDHIDGKCIALKCVLVIFLAEDIIHEIKCRQQKSCKHEGLRDRDSEYYKEHGKNDHDFSQDTGHAFFLPGYLLYNFVIVH